MLSGRRRKVTLSSLVCDSHSLSHIHSLAHANRTLPELACTLPSLCTWALICTSRTHCTTLLCSALLFFRAAKLSGVSKVCVLLFTLGDVIADIETDKATKDFDVTEEGK